MGLSFTVGGTRGTFEETFAQEVACVLDNAFGAEGDWEGMAPRQFGELCDTGWADLQDRAVQEVGREALTNLLALGAEGRGVYLPTHVRAVSLPLSRGEPLRCASLPSWQRMLNIVTGARGPCKQKAVRRPDSPALPCGGAVCLGGRPPNKAAFVRLDRGVRPARLAAW